LLKKTEIRHFFPRVLNPPKAFVPTAQVSIIFISTLSGHKVLKVPILLLLDLSKHLANPHSGKVRRLQSIKKQVVAVAASTRNLFAEKIEF